MSDDSSESRVANAVRLALCREPTAQEVQELGEYYQTMDDEFQAMLSIGRILFNTSEFLYLD